MGEERAVAPSVPSARLAALVRELRRLGGSAGTAELLLAHRALLAVDLASRETAKAALATVLCRSRADVARFEEAFATVFGSGGPLSPFSPRGPDNGAGEEGDDLDGPPQDDAPSTGQPAPAPSADGAAEHDPTPVPAASSTLELLRRKDFADYSDDEVADAARIVARLAAATPLRSSRRMRPVAGRGDRVDVRRTLREAARRGGVASAPAWRRRDVRPRRIVLVCDASGSMEPYARVLLQFLGAWVRSGRSVEAFAFGTRLTRITSELRGPDPAAALSRAAARITDWGAGTQIGRCIGQLNREHGRRIGRGAVVIVLSDGWDRGEPELLAAEMRRLRRTAHALVWLNPHAADPAFEPLTRGMRAALPATDELLAGNCILALEELAALLERDPRFTAGRARR
ncbi:vWA domain-containing protein [Conexibacter woesei]|uniref:VWA containing CoxE family protein n=1 Tax=Conexibacter woesei (strain DSM 14684 / CCUG 47730 / CIP 108061 / JCM 11494 / NBRC 100937 / ID131577) TaxID=469383 RepID=D3F4R5_CONWI|nr:VWA domain-containing protein [Conexibacter woesei]ADB52522.1 VWA containing CoxE family protein [Conexibacter woesei DSM 14684]